MYVFICTYIQVPSSERFDSDSCHRPSKPSVAPVAKSVVGLELLQRKGGKGVKARVSNVR